MTLQCVALGSNQDYSMQVILKNPNLWKGRKIGGSSEPVESHEANGSNVGSFWDFILTLLRSPGNTDRRQIYHKGLWTKAFHTPQWVQDRVKQICDSHYAVHGLCLKTYILGTSLVVQWLRLPMQVQSLVEELRSHMPHCENQKIKQNQYKKIQ